MFIRHSATSKQTVAIFVDEREHRVAAGVSVAAALLESGYSSVRHTPVTGSPRGPWCLMGTCFDCLVAVDSVTDVQACATTVREGMRISRLGPDSGRQRAGETDPWSEGP